MNPNLYRQERVIWLEQENERLRLELDAADRAIFGLLVLALVLFLALVPTVIWPWIRGLLGLI